MSDQHEAAEETTTPKMLPGATLRLVREQQGLSLGEVSGTLKFSIRQIEALEKDDYQQLQGKTFLRGFIRAYARLLKLPPDPLLEMTSDESPPSSEQIIVPANMGETDPEPFYRRHARMLGLATLLLLLSAGTVWLAGTGFRFHLPDQAPLESVPAAAVPEPVLDASPALEVMPPPAMQPAEPASTVSFEFSGYSWLEVKDASGGVLLTGEFSAGQTQSVTGKPPYQLWIGRVSSVKVNYAGQPVDLVPYTREDVARFTLE